MILNKINTMAVLIGFYLLCHMPRALAENSENNNGFHISGIRPYIFVLINNHYDKNTKISVPKKLKKKIEAKGYLSCLLYEASQQFPEASSVVGLDGKIKFAPWVHNIIIIEKKSSWLIACFGKYNGRNIIKTDEDRICLVQEAPTAIIELSKKDFSRVKQTHAEEKIKESINYTLIPVPFLNLDLLGAEPDYPNLSPEEIKLRNRLNRDKEIEEGAKLGTGEK